MEPQRIEGKTFVVKPVFPQGEIRPVGSLNLVVKPGMAAYDCLVIEKFHTTTPGLSLVSMWQYAEGEPMNWDGDFFTPDE
ncbi:MAG: hypothetical protein WD895_06995 [Acidimicrobiia bacterium]